MTGSGDEFVLNAPRDDTSTTSDLAFVERTHARLLHRAIDPQTLRRVLRQLSLGTSREEVVLAMRLTSEQPEPSRALVRAPDLQAMLDCPAPVFLTQAFHHLLGRAPDIDGALVYLRALRSGRHRLAILVALRHSAEGKARGLCGPLSWPLAEMLRMPAISWAVKARLTLAWLLFHCRRP